MAKVTRNIGQRILEILHESIPYLLPKQSIKVLKRTLPTPLYKGRFKNLLGAEHMEAVDKATRYQPTPLPTS